MIGEALTLGSRAVTKWLRNPFAAVAALIQGAFWLALFGNSFNPANAISSFPASGGSLGLFQQAFGGAPTYITFLTPGVLCIIALTGMSFMGVDVVMDRTSGFLSVISAYPIPRTSIYLGAVVQNLAKAMVTVPLTFAIALVVPDGLKLSPGFGALNLLGVFAVIALLAAVFSMFFTGIAISVKSVDSFFGAVNFLTFPIMFTSTGLFPISFFPSWLKPFAQANPVSLASDAARLLIIHPTLSAAQLSSLAGDVAGLGAFLAVFAVLGVAMARNALKPR